MIGTVSNIYLSKEAKLLRKVLREESRVKVEVSDKYNRYSVASDKREPLHKDYLNKDTLRDIELLSEEILYNLELMERLYPLYKRELRLRLYLGKEFYGNTSRIRILREELSFMSKRYTALSNQFYNVVKQYNELLK